MIELQIYPIINFNFYHAHGVRGMFKILNRIKPTKITISTALAEEIKNRGHSFPETWIIDPTLEGLTIFTEPDR